MRIKEGVHIVLTDIYASRSNKFMLLNAVFLIGVILASLFHAGGSSFIPLYICAWIGAIACLFLCSRVHKALFIIGVIGILAGVARFAVSEPRQTAGHIKFYNGLYTTFVGVVGEEPKASFNQKQKILVEVERVKQVNDTQMRLPDSVFGTVAVYAPHFPTRKAGDELEVTCALQDTREFGKGTQAETLHKDGVWAVCDDALVKRIAENRFTRGAGILNTFRTQVDARVRELFNEPYAGLLGGILYGARAGVSAQLLTDFQRTGLSHIMAISGYNITIMVTALAILAVYAGVRRQYAFWILSLMIILFVIFTGASASVVRAGVMGFLVLLARQMGRGSAITRVLLLSASILILFNPRVLLFDVGFQLSYLSTIGLVYGVPLLEKIFDRVPEIFGLKEITLCTVAALIATTPLILYQFGRFSLIAPVANLLVLPFIPMTMAFGFAALILSFMWAPLGVVFAWIAWLPLAYIVQVVSALSQLEFSSFSLRIAFPVMAAYYIFMMYVVYVQTKKLNMTLFL
ncbi:MAG: ComEC/Rec2 family competence protein [Candidatus Magasanikbacteria bacterium]|nr:ComEC/Rec2 family competence protein [Candidatus Magasanikbacteria bacterium]